MSKPQGRSRIRVGTSSVTIVVTEQQIYSGKEGDMPEVELATGASVIYQLDAAASAKYAYMKKKDEAFRLAIGGQPNQNSKVTIKRIDGNTLSVTMKKHATLWEGKATLGFDARPGGGAQTPPPLDPIIINGGG